MRPIERGGRLHIGDGASKSYTARTGVGSISRHNRTM